MVRHDFSGKVAFITGGSSGIGLATAQAFTPEPTLARLPHQRAHSPASRLHDGVPERSLRT